MSHLVFKNASVQQNFAWMNIKRLKKQLQPHIQQTECCMKSAVSSWATYYSRPSSFKVATSMTLQVHELKARL